MAKLLLVGDGLESSKHTTDQLRHPSGQNFGPTIEIVAVHRSERSSSDTSP